MRVAVRLTTTAGLMTLGLMVGASPAAWAGQGYESITGTFGKACQSSPCPGGQFKGPTGVAVNDNTGDVYVVDSGDDRVEWFNADGSSFEGQFDGSGAPDGRFLEPEGIAIDNDSASPSYEDVYVADVGHDVIDKFSPTGEYLGDFAGGRCEEAAEPPPCSGSRLIPFSGELNVATDASGNVWIYEAAGGGGFGEIYEFNDEGSPVESPYELEDKGVLKANQRPGFAVDSSGDVYATGGQRLYKYNRAKRGTPEGEREVVKESAKLSLLASLAIISSNNNLLLDEGSFIELFKAPIFGGAQSLFTFPATGLSESAGIAVNGAKGEGTIYATQRGDDDVDVFESAPPEAPKVISVSAFSTSSEEGGFSAVIDPENRTTKYSFKYSDTAVTNGNGELELTGLVHTAAGEAEIPAEFGDQTVSVGERYFEATRTYYYRVIATNEVGEAKSEVTAYTKLPAVLPGEALELTSTGVALASEVNPDFEGTTYTFYLADTEQHEHGESVAIHSLTGLVHERRLKEEEAICPGIVDDGGAGTLPGYDQPCPVTAEIEGLTPGETYYFRVVATNEVTEEASNANEGHPIAGEWVAFTPYPPPRAMGGQASAVTRNSADLSGEVDPGGTTGSYDFAYIEAGEYERALENGAANPGEPGFQAALEHGAPSPYAEGATTAPVALPASNATQTAGPALAAGLRAGTTYDYALVATNRFGLRTYGPNRTFTTQGAAPLGVATGTATGITRTTATVSGTIDTNGQETTYGFELATTPGEYGAPTGLQTIPEGEEGASEVSVALGGLQPGTVYHYRLVATGGEGAVYGLEQSFATTPTPGLLTIPLSPSILDYVAPSPTVERAIRGPPPTRAQKLRKALRQCRKNDRAKSRRERCEKAARKKYGAAKKRR
jgi:DNA-binding beta-propeller fold protein YncE